jgi:long-chain acyl-CoA synthetase
MTLDLLLRQQAIDHPERAFLHHERGSWSYAQVEREVAGLAGHLAELGFRCGERLFLWLPKCAEVVVGFLAANRAGGMAVPINYKAPSGELADVFARFRPRAVLLHARFVEDYRALERRDPGGEAVVVVGEAPAGVGTPYEQAVRHAPLDVSRGSPEQVAYLNFTSGSTGAPRAAAATHSQIIWNARSMREVFGLSERDVHLPMFAVFSHPHELFARALLTGGSTVLHEQVHPRALVEKIRRYGVTCVMAVATVYRLMLRELARRPVPSLRIAESGGMPTPPELNEEFRARSGVPILPVWGSTETTGPAVATRPGDPAGPGALGRRCPFYELRVVDEEGRELPAGECGELLVAGPAVVERYYGEPEATARAFRDGWYHTGDLVSRDERGFYRFLGRKQQLIKVGGLKVFAREVVEAIRSHPAVEEVVVVADREELRGEIHRAVIAPDLGRRFVEEELIPMLRERLARYKIPRTIATLPALPRLAGGKVDLRAALQFARRWAEEAVS